MGFRKTYKKNFDNSVTLNWIILEDYNFSPYLDFDNETSYKC